MSHIWVVEAFSPEQAIDLAKWDKQSTWTDLIAKYVREEKK